MCLMKQRMFSLMLNNCKVEDRFFYDILCWMHTDTTTNLEANSEFLNETLTISSSLPEETVTLEILLLWQISVLYSLALNRLDIRSSIYTLQNVLSKTRKKLLTYQEKNLYVLESLKASLLQWIVCPSLLIKHANEVANDIFTYIEGYKPIPAEKLLFKEFATQYETIIGANSEVFISCEVCLLLQQFSNENDILEWLDRLKEAPFELIKKIYHLLCGLFLTKYSSPKLSTKIFSIILNYVEKNKILSSQMLTMILYKLSNTKDAQLHFVLLKAMPKMVVLRENIPKVMSTLQAISQGSPDLYNFSLSLMFDAWKVEPKCYYYLENLLVQYNVTKNWEGNVTKAFILKELCKIKPELYGRDMVAHLSKILNDCNDDDGSLPCALAIDGITLLCRAEVIDVVTTWATLWPKFKNDTRIPVIKSLCLLISEIPSLPYTESYVQLKDDVVGALWDYVSFGDAQITEAALNTLTSFSFEQICAQLPEKYLDESVMLERQRSAGGTPHTVPGHIWIKFLMENRASKEACNFVIKMISTEVANYLKHVYQVKGSKEPINYKYLPTHSVVRGIGDFVRTWADKWKNSINDLLYIECLKILSKEYSKPLPPLDWCFLQELLHEPKTKEYSVDIACHQAILSGTAQGLWKITLLLSQKETDIISILKNLKYLANSIQPMILKPFFENALNYAVNTYNTECEENLLLKVTKHLGDVLSNNEIQETNKITIGQVLSDQISLVDIASELFDIFLQCVVSLPTKYIQEIASVETDLTEERFAKVIKIKCAAAVHSSVAPLSWLNDVIDIASTLDRDECDTLNEFTTVFRKHIKNAECALWLLDLIGQIQAKVADRCTEREMVYYFDIFILTVVEFSSYSAFIMDRNANSSNLIREKLFPQALNALLNTDHWSICTGQVLEWLYHVNTEETVPMEYRNLFGFSLAGIETR
ncbi:hypothetical protein NQ318_001075 [Aromia moschata]|uniref:DUF3730 domain-containing protein n=1 Tax=Aromia moschata TaxID=1265417 RepID=A0AAV8ZEJ3_9CUCU|nr:hypothetical protein NQ318_001075 [Aromia moschata]